MLLWLLPLHISVNIMSFRFSLIHSHIVVAVLPFIHNQKWPVIIAVINYVFLVVEFGFRD